MNQDPNNLVSEPMELYKSFTFIVKLVKNKGKATMTNSLRVAQVEEYVCFIN